MKINNSNPHTVKGVNGTKEDGKAFESTFKDSSSNDVQTKDLTSYKSAVESAEAKVTAAEPKITTAAAKVTSAQTKLSAAINTLNSTKPTIDKQIQTGTDANNQPVFKTVQEPNPDYKAAQDAVAAAEGELSAAESEKTTAEEEKATAEAEQTKAQEEYEKAEKENEEAQEAIEKAQEEAEEEQKPDVESDENNENQTEEYSSLEFFNDFRLKFEKGFNFLSGNKDYKINYAYNVSENNTIDEIYDTKEIKADKNEGKINLSSKNNEQTDCTSTNNTDIETLSENLQKTAETLSSFPTSKELKNITFDELYEIYEKIYGKDEANNKIAETLTYGYAQKREESVDNEVHGNYVRETLPPCEFVYENGCYYKVSKNGEKTKYDISKKDTNTYLSAAQTDIQQKFKDYGNEQLEQIKTSNEAIYNLDFENLTDDEIDKVNKLYFMQELVGKTIETRNQMYDYFDSLGVFDNGYDTIKDTFGFGVTQDEIEEYYKNEQTTNELLIAAMQNGDSAPAGQTFEDIYFNRKGVEYNPEYIAQAKKGEEDYKNVVNLQNTALQQEQLLADATPQEALNYFNYLAETQNTSVTGEELFNNYYAQIFKDNPGAFSEENNAVTCTGIKIEGDILYQELTFSDRLSEENIKDFIASEGNIEEIDGKYYVRTFIADETEGASIEDTYGNNIFYFNNTNKTIKNNSLYLEQVKNLYDTKNNAEGLFDEIIDEYPKMYEKAFGKDILTNALTDYINDEDTYAGKASQAISIGCFAASFIPGVQVPMALIFGAMALDNAVDLGNILTNRVDDSNELPQWFKQTAIEAGTVVIGMGINSVAQKGAYKLCSKFISEGSTFVTNHMSGTEAVLEYALDNAASVGFDIGRGLITGELRKEDGSFDWQALRSMVVSDLIFNTADLRNGMTLYKSLKAGDFVDIGDGVKLKITDDNQAIYRYQNGDTITVKADGSASYENIQTDTSGNQSVTYSGDLEYGSNSIWIDRKNGTAIDMQTGRSYSLAFVDLFTNNGNSFSFGKVLQSGSMSCANATIMNGIADSPEMQMKFCEMFTYDEATGEYRAKLFGEDITVKKGENPLAKIEEAYSNSTYANEGNYFGRIFTEIFGDANDVIAKPTDENIRTLANYAVAKDTILSANFTEGDITTDAGETLSPSHAYRVVEIDSKSGKIKLEDPETGKVHTVSKSAYEDTDFQVEGKTYSDSYVEEGATSRIVGGKKASKTYTDDPLDTHFGELQKVFGNDTQKDGDYILLPDGRDGTASFDSETGITTIVLGENGKNGIIELDQDGTVTEYKSTTDKKQGIYKRTYPSTNANNDIEETYKTDDNIIRKKRYNTATPDGYTETWRENGIFKKKTHLYGDASEKYVIESVTKNGTPDGKYKEVHNSNTNITITRKIGNDIYTEKFNDGYFEVTKKGDPNYKTYYSASSEPQYDSGIPISQIDLVHTTCKDSSGYIYDFGSSTDANDSTIRTGCFLRGVHTVEALENIIKIANNNGGTIDGVIDGQYITANVSKSSITGGKTVVLVTYTDNNGNVSTTKITMTGTNVNCGVNSSNVVFEESCNGCAPKTSVKTFIPEGAYIDIDKQYNNIKSVSGPSGSRYFAVLDANNKIHYFKKVGDTTYEVANNDQTIISHMKELKSIPMIKLSVSW